MGLRPTRAEMKIQSFPLTRGPVSSLGLMGHDQPPVEGRSQTHPLRSTNEGAEFTTSHPWFANLCN